MIILMHILLWRAITVIRPNNTKRNKIIAFKNNVLFVNNISKINDVLIDDVEDLDVVMAMYNVLE